MTMVTLMRLYSICACILSGYLAFGQGVQVRTAHRSGGSSSRSSSSADYFAKNKIFERTVYIDVNAGNITLTSPSLVSISALEHQFVRSFNALSEELCDVEGLRILSAAIQYTNEAKTEYIIRRGGNKYALYFKVHATCDNCNPWSVTLFDYRPLTSRRRRTMELPVGAKAETVFDRQLSSKKSKKDSSSSSSSYSSYSSKKSGKGKGKGKGGKGNKRANGGGSVHNPPGHGQGPAKCTSSKPANRAPTDEEFREVYSNAILNNFAGSTKRRQLGRSFVVGGRLPIQAINGVFEVFDGKCNKNYETFESVMTVEVSGNFQAAKSDEYRELAEAFFQNYNGLQAHGCDFPKFREVEAVEITMATPDRNGNGFFLVVLKVVASCQGVGCSNGISLFDDKNLLRRLQTNTTNTTNTTGTTDEICECPVSPARRSAPSTREMSIEFDATIQELRTSGLVTNFVRANVVTEVGAQDLTAAPSGAPTRSSKPSSSSKPSISFKPSGGPPTISRSPSGGPSSAPSASNRPSTSKAPSSQPSLSFKPSVSDAPSDKPSRSGAPSSSPSKSLAPSSKPSKSDSPSSEPSTSKQPSKSPSGSAAPSISKQPSSNPSLSLQPSSKPSMAPSKVPSGSPSLSKKPSQSPSSNPSGSNKPSVSKNPSSQPSKQPSSQPSKQPSKQPSSNPSGSDKPSISKAPSNQPSKSDKPSISKAPSRQPSKQPSLSSQPSNNPSK